MVPNIITGVRVVLVIPLIAYISAGNYNVAAILFAIAVATDALDGQAARRLGQESVTGGLFDLTADRVIMTPSLFFITLKGLLDSTGGLFPFAPWAYAAIIFAADAMTLAGVFMFTRVRRRDPSVEFPSPPPIVKATYPTQCTVVLAALLGLNPPVIAACMYAAAVATLVSFVVYMKKGGFVFKEGI